MSPVKIQVDVDHQLELDKSSAHHHRRRPKRSSINSNSLLSTVASVHELMSFVIYKDHPPTWLQQTDLFQEYTNKSHQISADYQSSDLLPHSHQQLHRKQRCNLHMYARSAQSWQLLPSPSLSSSPIHDSTLKLKREVRSSPSPPADTVELLTPLNISVKQEPKEENSLLITTKSKSNKRTAIENTRRRQILCKKKLPENAPYHRRLRRQRRNSAENQEPMDKKDSSSSASSSSQSDSNLSNSSSSSIEHTSPSPTTTVSRSSSRRSSPLEYMRGHGARNTRLSSPLRIQTSLSPRVQSLSTPQRRSTRIWAPSSFYINPMWILPTVVSSKRLLAENLSSSPPPSDSGKRPRRRCRS